jgi:trehalose-6-phosphate synthase
MERLKPPLDLAPRPRLQVDEDLINISTKCSETAAELLAELQKLQPKSRGGLHQALKKSVLAIRRKDFVKGVQNKLDAYQRILDTRILVRLNGRSIEQMKDFSGL